MLTKNNRKSNNLKKLYIIASILVVISLIFVGLEMFNVTHFFNSKPIETTSKEPSAQSDFNNGKEREIIDSNKNEGIVTDTQGNIPTIPNQSEWTSSTDGVISVYSPVINSILTNGSSLSGESTTDNISFRLIDNISGVIAQGKITVVNKKFSGIFGFETKATEGRLDVFTADTNGVESSIIEIPVRFN